MVRAGGVNAVLVEDDLLELDTDLVTTMAGGLDVDVFEHHESRRKLKKISAGGRTKRGGGPVSNRRAAGARLCVVVW